MPTIIGKFDRRGVFTPITTVDAHLAVDGDVRTVIISVSNIDAHADRTGEPSRRTRGISRISVELDYRNSRLVFTNQANVLEARSGRFTLLNTECKQAHATINGHISVLHRLTEC